MEIPPQEAPPGPGADAEAEAEEAPAEAGSPSGASPPADGRLKVAAKHVTFPSDEDIVSGAVEPKDPWRHGSYGEGCEGEPRVSGGTATELTPMEVARGKWHLLVISAVPRLELEAERGWRESWKAAQDWVFKP